MSFQMPASPAGSTPYQGASAPCICPSFASYDQKIQSIKSRTHMEVVALTAIKLLYSDEAETEKLLQICPFSRCKEFNHANPQALVDHIITCNFSSDSEICCAGCKKYKNAGPPEREPIHLEREPAHAERETYGRMDIRRPFRKLSSLFQASIRSNHSSASSSRTGSMISADSPRPSRDFASPMPRLDRPFTPPPLPPQTHLYELTDSPLTRELGDTSSPSEIGGVGISPVHHIAELAVQPAEATRREPLGEAINFPAPRPRPRQQQRRLPPSPPPLQTNYAIPMPHVGDKVHRNWTCEGPLSMTNGNSFFGSDVTESPTDIEPNISANFNAFRGLTPEGGLGDIVSPLGSIDVSPSSSRGSGHESRYAAFEPQMHASFGTAHIPSNLPHQSFLEGNARMRWGPSELPAAFPVQTPPRHDSQLSQDSNAVNVVPPSFQEHAFIQPQTRTYSGSTSTSTGTLESTGTNSSAALGFMNLPSQQSLPKATVQTRAHMLSRGSSANPRPSQWRCRYQPCDYYPTGKIENWRSYVRKHEESHKGNLHQCPRCGNMLSRKDNLKTHLRRSCKGLIQRIAERPSPEVPFCMHAREDEAWLAGALSTAVEDDMMQWHR